MANTCENCPPIPLFFFFFFWDCAKHFVHQPVEDLEVPGAACGGLDALDALDAVRLVYHGTYHLEVS